MSDNDRARERLDFEAAAEAIEKGEWRAKPNLQSTQQVMEFLGRDSRFVPSTTVEVAISLEYIYFFITILMLYSFSDLWSEMLKCVQADTAKFSNRGEDDH